MENDAISANKKETRENLTMPLVILIFLAIAWFVYVYANVTWIAALQQVISWLTNPTVNYTPIQVEGIPLAFLATIEILVLGAASSCTLLANEKDTLVKFISALGLGAGFTGLITIILGISDDLFQLPLNMMILLLCAGFLSVNVYLHRGKEKRSMHEFLKVHFSLRNFRRPTNFRMWLLASFAIGIIFFFCFYHALLTVVVHWDALVYHATMAVFMYNGHGIPLIAGPSIGIEMSANFPPLFSALGAYYYIQIGAIDDFYLRAISPVMGILTVLATYKIGEVLAGKKYGIMSALFLAMTPLFFRYSMYATSYSTLTFFGTISVLFLFLGMIRADTRYWIMCGLFYGFALLTSYLAIYLAPFFVVALIYHFIEMKNHFKVIMGNSLLLVLSTLVIGGVWYLRNLILLGNPIYPTGYTLLGGINIDPLIMQTTFKQLQWSAANSFFGGEVSALAKIAILIIYRTHFPAISLLTILGIALLPTLDKKFLLVLAWPLILSISILGGMTWGFPRQVVFTLPGFALLSSLPIVKAIEKCEKYNGNIENSSKSIFTKIRKKLTLRKNDLLGIGIAIILILAFLFPSLAFSMGGKMWMENIGDEPTSDYLWFLKNPNADKWSVLEKLYPEAVGWQWLNDHLQEGEKVATLENRIYYVKNCSNDYFFYLDGWEARQLYHIADPEAIIQYLRNESVKYVLDAAWDRTNSHLDILPMTQFLGSPYFPIIIDRSGNPTIYNVGPIETPITANSSILLSINQEGWSELRVMNGTLVQSVIAGSDSARLYVVASDLAIIKITYLDVGKDNLSINLYDPHSKAWIYDYATIEKNDTNEWKTYEFLAPISEAGFVEFDLYASYENFTISRIEATAMGGAK
jgi:hypothetical protein